jgi:RimJ/RimL family protein N-acetyltransferase
VIPAVLTERLLLRAFGEDDLDAYAAMLADEEVVRFVGGLQSREDAWRNMALLLGHWTLRGYGWWAVCDRSTGALLGRCGLWFPEGWPELEVGWAFARSAWGNGYATEAATAAIAWGAAELGLRRIASVIDPANTRSRAVAERLGMTYDRPVVARGTAADLYARAL